MCQQEVEALKGEANEMRVRIAELTVTVKNDQQEIQRLEKEAE